MVVHVRKTVSFPQDNEGAPMFRRSAAVLALVFAASFYIVSSAAVRGASQGKPATHDEATHDHDAPAPGGWTVPPDAQQKKSPLTADAKVLALGKSVFKSKCQKCHGPGGLGDGPDADPDHQEDMDLTKASRASKNPEGVMFYKVSNGRKKPKMPAFKEQLSENEIWSVVAYAQTLRKQ
jgi:mono/diheme cytochrome c family protein